MIIFLFLFFNHRCLSNHTKAEPCSGFSIRSVTYFSALYQAMSSFNTCIYFSFYSSALPLDFYSSLSQILHEYQLHLVYKKRHLSFRPCLRIACLYSYFVCQHSKVDCANGRWITGNCFDTSVSQFTPLLPLKSPHNLL